MTYATARKTNERHVTPKSTLSHASQGSARIFFLNHNVAGQEIPGFLLNKNVIVFYRRGSYYRHS